MRKKIALYLSYIFATFGFVGLSRVAPGTCASLAAVLTFVLMQNIICTATLLLITVACFFLGIVTTNILQKRYKVHDPSWIVIDEVATMWGILLFFPPSLICYATAFAIFRFFDILKPFPINWLDKHVAGGFGVMIDDVAAGIVTVLIMKLFF